MYSLFRSLPRSAVLSLALLNPWGSPQAFAQDDGWSSDPDTFEGSEAEGPPPESESGWTAEAPPPVADGPEAYPADAFGPGASLAEANSPGPPPTPQNFEAALNPHGTWIQVSGLGRVWQPAPAVVGGDFVPYVTGGSWVYTQAGWTFHSQWDWGWAPFHYGRWHLAAGYGWVWWPNTTWAPAWVEWRRGGSYVGWAPLPPPGYALSFSVGATGWSFTSYRAFGRPWSARHARAPVWYRGVPWGGDRGGSGWHPASPPSWRRLSGPRYVAPQPGRYPAMAPGRPPSGPRGGGFRAGPPPPARGGWHGAGPGSRGAPPGGRVRN